MNKQLLIQGALFLVIGALTPVAAILGSDSPLNGRSIAAMAVAAVLAGASSLKAYLSTTFADSKESALPGTESRAAMQKHK